ncbi:hypothetical protein CEXT_202031 [Caerostris extrusa]|uniref:Uncharacterized protein n=1 Tax=Caerostris extrusa TaxID=172846 RepID=A0AAV4NYC3_CAEEX|nr:hypothetical protein CEXT_202031 [Caerostris extrusa]
MLLSLYARICKNHNTAGLPAHRIHNAASDEQPLASISSFFFFFPKTKKLARPRSIANCVFLSISLLALWQQLRYLHCLLRFCCAECSSLCHRLNSWWMIKKAGRCRRLQFTDFERKCFSHVNNEAYSVVSKNLRGDGVSNIRCGSVRKSHKNLKKISIISNPQTVDRDTPLPNET